MNTTARTITNQNCFYGMSFASVYPLNIAKADKQGGTKAEVDTASGLEAQISKKRTFQEFFGSAPNLTPARDEITGLICGVRVEEIDHPLVQNIRYLDMIDEIAEGRALKKALRTSLTLIRRLPSSCRLAAGRR
jgi:hypothetical protein